MLIKDMAKRVHELAREKGWWRDQQDPNTGELNREAVIALIPEKLALIHSEISEALEEYRGDRLETYWEIPSYGAVTMTDIHEGDWSLLAVVANAIIRTHEIDDLPGFFSDKAWETQKEDDLFVAREALAAFIVTNYKPEGFDIEMADAVIRIGDLLEPLDLDLDLAIKRKHLYNQKRSYRHGGKKC